MALAAFLLGAVMTLGPLVLRHLTHPEIHKRAEVTWVWNHSDNFSQRVAKVLARYPGHFGADFLFRHGDPDIAYCPPKGYGLFQWYTLPMMVGGLIFLFMHLKTSRSAQVLLIWVILYPAADLLNEHPTMHGLRSLPGVCALTLLAAIGLIFMIQWLWQRHRRLTFVLSFGAAVVVLVLVMGFLGVFYEDFNTDPRKYLVGHQDLLEACAWLRPRLKDEDAVFVTGTGMSQPYIYTLVGLQYDPRQWFRDEKKVIEGPLPNGMYRNEEIALRYGKMHFIYGDSARADLENLAKNGRGNRVVFIMRPGELQLGNGVSPVRQIRNPEGSLSLVIYEFTI